MANNKNEGSTAVDECARRRGRPLDAARDEAILTATIELLGERGFDRFTVKDIAERAGAGLGAIYRRWPTKQDVVVAAVRLLEEGTPAMTLSCDVEVDLAHALIASTRTLQGCLGAVIPGLVSAMRDHAELAVLLRETAVTPRLDLYRELLAPAFPDPVERSMRAEMAMAMPLYRLLFAGDLPTEREIRENLVPLILGHPLPESKQRTRTNRRRTRARA